MVLCGGAAYFAHEELYTLPLNMSVHVQFIFNSMVVTTILDTNTPLPYWKFIGMFVCKEL